jgi:hypothetical protein
VELQPQKTRETRFSSGRTWQAIRPEESQRLSDSRQQLHHAVQFAAAAGISFLDPEPDDSHTSLEWVPSLSGLFSRVIPAGTMFRIGVIPADLSLVIAIENDQPFARHRLHGRTIVEAVEWIRTHIASLGAESSRYTLKRDYDIPTHDVDMGEAFDASDQSAFDEMSRWLANGAAVLNSFVRRIPEASEIRCWPHHFDIAALLPLPMDRTIGVGLEPGDDYYDEPYFYVNMDPAPTASQARSRPLWGLGTWHTREWIGAVLPGSRLGAATSQDQQVREFIDSAVSACRGLATLS